MLRVPPACGAAGGLRHLPSRAWRPTACNYRASSQAASPSSSDAQSSFVASADSRAAAPVTARRPTPEAASRQGQPQASGNPSPNGVGVHGHFNCSHEANGSDGGGSHGVGGALVELDAATRERLLSHGLASTSSAAVGSSGAATGHSASRKDGGGRVASSGGRRADGHVGQQARELPKSRQAQQALQQQLLLELADVDSEAEARPEAAAKGQVQGDSVGITDSGMGRSVGSQGRKKGAVKGRRAEPRKPAGRATDAAVPEPMLLVRAGGVTMEQLLQQSLEQRQPQPLKQPELPQQRRRPRQQHRSKGARGATDAPHSEDVGAAGSPAPGPLQPLGQGTPAGLEAISPGRRGMQRQPHLRLVQDEKYGAPPGGVTEARSIELTENIRTAANLQQLTAQLAAHADVYNAINITAFAARLAQLAAPRSDGGSGGAPDCGAEVPSDALEAGLGAEAAAAAPLRWQERRQAAQLAARLCEVAQRRLLDLDPEGVVTLLHALARLSSAGIMPAAAAASASAATTASGSGSAAGLGAGADAGAEAGAGAGVGAGAGASADAGTKGAAAVTAAASAAAAAAAAAAVQEELCADLVFVAGQNIDIYHVQAVSNLVWALGSLAPRSAAWAGRGWWEGLFLCTQDRVQGYPTQALANIMWALGRLRQRPPATWQRAFFSATAARLHLFTTQGVANYVQGAAKLQLKVPVYLMEELMRYGASNLRDFSGQGLVLYLWGMAKLMAAARTSPEAVTAWLEEAMLPELNRRLQLAPPQPQPQPAKRRASATAKAAATAKEGAAKNTTSSGSGSDGDDQDAAAAVAAAAAAARGDGGGGTAPLTIRQLATVLYALAELGYAPAGKSGSSWLRSYWGAVGAALGRQQQQQQQGVTGARRGASGGGGSGGGGGGGDEVQALSNLLHAAAELRVALPPALVEVVLGRCRGWLAAFPPQALSSTAWSLHRLRVRPPAEWLGAFMQACWFAMPRMSVTELATLLYGLAGGLEAVGGAPEREWLRRAEGEWLQGMDRSGPVELYRGLAALAGWRHCPGPEWQAALLRQLAAKLPDMPTWQLPQVVRHLADVGASPPLPLLNALVAGAVGGRVAGAADLALLATGLARLGRQVSPRLLASLLAELNALPLTPDAVAAAARGGGGGGAAPQQQQEAAAAVGARGRWRGRGRAGATSSSRSTPTGSVDEEDDAAGGVRGAAAVAGRQAPQAQQPARGRGGGGGSGGGGSAVDVLGLQLLLDTAWALAALRYTPAALWVAGCLAAVESRLPSLTPQQLEAALAAAAHLRHMTGASAAPAAASTAVGSGQAAARQAATTAPATAVVVLVRPGPGRSWLAAAEARLRVLQAEADAEARTGGLASGQGAAPATLQEVELEAAAAAAKAAEATGEGLPPAAPAAACDTGSGSLLFVATPTSAQAAAAQESRAGGRGGNRGGRWGCLPGAWRALRDAQSGQ
ncbi:hypothetical protein HYH02_004114 [Chlamydomonas schloesseri]|uniref:RAP domain-containing protein n=1 Tax=Chlamydomonas schloesseri TaxID=2026947 RepID=A0A835WRG2_9CHLO|nr:hypothetical protein HYH02_004114 [Chlamydomonas schloesseri]|eukprot:KAG2451516.1 hypothetical protein HYH02_004114 [Chlamydomonas schloesseri]